MALDWLKGILGDAHTEDIEKKIEAEIGKRFVAAADYKEKNEALKNVQKQLEDANRTVDDLKKLDAAGLSAEVERLKGENATMQKQHEDELKAYELKSKLRAKLSETVYDPDDVINLLDLSKIETDEKGEIKSDIDKMIKPISESKPHYFKKITNTREGTGEPGGGTRQSTGDKLDTEQLEKMSMADYRAYREKAGFPKA